MNLPVQISHNTGAYRSASFIGGVILCILGAIYIDLAPGDHTELKWVLGMVGTLTFQRPVTWTTKPPTVEVPAALDPAPEPQPVSPLS